MKPTIKEITRTWKEPQEYSRKCLSFSLGENRILLVKDSDYSRTWDIHFEFTQGAPEDIRDQLVKSITEYIKPGEYLTSCGYMSWEDFQVFKKFIGPWEDTGMIRVLKDNIYLPILKRK